MKKLDKHYLTTTENILSKRPKGYMSPIKLSTKPALNKSPKAMSPSSKSLSKKNKSPRALNSKVGSDSGKGGSPRGTGANLLKIRRSNPGDLTAYLH